MFHIGINMMRLKSSFVVLLFGFVSYSSLGFTQPEQSKVSESTVIQSLQSANLIPIPIGSLSTQDNARHQAYCKSIGANDVTNRGKIMLRPLNQIKFSVLMEMEDYFLSLRKQEIGLRRN